MGKDKKLFKPEDFDKQKKLFTSEDFDKYTETDENTTGKNVDNQLENNSTHTPIKHLQKIIGSFMVIVIVVIGYLFLKPGTNKEETEEKRVTEVIDSSTSELESRNVNSLEDKKSETSDTHYESSPDKGPKTPDKVKESELEKSNVKEIITQQKTDVIVKIEGSTETLAREVIAGKYANWPERERRLGKRYNEIQSKVNEMYRKGQVK